MSTPKVQKKRKFSGSPQATSMEARIIALEQEMKSLKACNKKQNVKITELENENKHLMDLISTLDGRSARLETSQSEVKDDICDIRFRSMKRNAIIKNLPQPSTHEDMNQSKAIVIRFLCEDMKIPRPLIESEEFLNGKIKVDIAHRFGAPIQGNKPMVVVFKDRSSKELVMSYARNLRGSNFSIQDQLPADMSSRRNAQYPLFKELKEKKEKVSLKNDTLYLNNCVVNPNFNKNTLPVDTLLDSAILDRKLHQSTVRNINGTRLKAHVMEVKSEAEAKTALAKIYQDRSLATATHNVYSYRVSPPGKPTTEGHDDDGSYGTGTHINTLLKGANVENAIVIITIWKGPRNVYFQDKLNAIKEISVEALTDSKILVTEAQAHDILDPQN